MGKIKDLTGMVFGKWYVTAFAGADKRGKSTWHCECSCQEKTNGVVAGGNLKNGHSTSCGCHKKDAASRANLKDLKGMKFGKLNVISVHGKNVERRILWLCECDCPERKCVVVSSKELINGDTKSCGCLKINFNKARAEKDNAEKDLENLTLAGLDSLSDLKYGFHRNSRGQIFVGLSKKGRPMWLNEKTFNSNKIRGMVGRAIKNNPLKSLKTKDILCAPIGFVRDYITAQFTEGMSWDNCGEWHFDHIIPMAYAKTQPDPQFADEILNHYSNIRPLWGPENLKKKAKLPENVAEKFEELKEKVTEYRRIHNITP